MKSPAGIKAIGNLDYTMLLCSNVDVMVAFYGTVMQFTLRRHIPGRYAEFAVGSSTLALRLRSRPYDGPAGAAEAASVQLAFRVPPGEVAVAAQQLEMAGIKMLEPMADLEDFGHRTLFFADPENNIVEIYAEI